MQHRKEVTISAPHFTEMPALSHPWFIGDPKLWKSYATPKVSLMVASEKWGATIECQETPATDRELALLSIHLPNGKVLSGTISHFQALEAIIYNAKNHMQDFAQMPYTDKKEEESVLDSLKELTHALSLFSKQQ